MRRITFCLVCGASAPASAERCSECGAPVGKQKPRAPKLTRSYPSPLAILCGLAVVAAVSALVLVLT